MWDGRWRSWLAASTRVLRGWGGYFRTELGGKFEAIDLYVHQRLARFASVSTDSGDHWRTASTAWLRPSGSTA